MNVLVTGATGFTGGHLARFLAARGDSVRALVRDPGKAGALAGAGIDVVPGDLEDRGSLERALAGMDVVYNIAALYRDAGLPAAEYRAVNATAVGTIVEIARAAGARRVVQCSTVGVHGDVQHPPANEDAPLRPGDFYQVTKLEGERIAIDAARRTGMELVIARPTGIYGPADRRLFKVFGKIATRRFVMLGPGRNFYHVTYIDDLCEGFRLCGTSPRAAGRTYILGGGEITTLRRTRGSHRRSGRCPSASRAPAGVAGLARRRRLRGGLRAARDVAADLPAACRLLPQEPRVRHQPREAGARVQSAGRSA